MAVIYFPPERVFKCATLMRRQIAFAVMGNFSNLHLKNEKACNCDNLRKFVLLFISNIIKKNGQTTALGMPVIPFPSEGVFNSATFRAYMQAHRRHIKVGELTFLKFANLKMVCEYLRNSRLRET